MVSLVLVGIASLMMINFKPPAADEVTAVGIPPLEVRGSAVIHKQIPYTLNFEQQNLVKDALLKSQKVKKEDYPEIKGPFDFDKIVIYRFNAPDVAITPIQYKDNNLVFFSPELSKDSYLLELSGGALKTMIQSSFDP